MSANIYIVRAVLEEALCNPLLQSTLSSISQVFNRLLLKRLKEKNLLAPETHEIFAQWAGQQSETNQFLGATLPEFSTDLLGHTLEGRLLMLTQVESTLSQSPQTFNQLLNLLQCLNTLSMTESSLKTHHFEATLALFINQGRISKIDSDIALVLNKAYVIYINHLKKIETEEMIDACNLPEDIYDNVMEKANAFKYAEQQWQRPIQTSHIAFSGAPSSGKTTTGNTLKELDFNIEEEATRTYINELLGKGVNLDEFIPTQGFIEETFARKMALEANLPIAHLMSIIDSPAMDSHAYVELHNRTLSCHTLESSLYHSEMHRYLAVFLFEPLPLVKDGFRIENDEQQQALYSKFSAIHASHGYNSIIVPKFTNIIPTDDLMNAAVKRKIIMDATLPEGEEITIDAAISIEARKAFILERLRQLCFLKYRMPHPMSHLLLSQKYGEVYVISGPYGVGKTSMIRAILSPNNIERMVPYTTRSPRPTEKNGVDYYFVEHEEFNLLFSENSYIVCEEIMGHKYGMLTKDLHEKLRQNQSVILELTPENLEIARPRLSEPKSIFIHPPYHEALNDRLAVRDHTMEEQQLRYCQGLQMLAMVDYSKFNFHLINQTLDISIALLNQIISAGAPDIEDVAEIKQSHPRHEFGFFLPPVEVTERGHENVGFDPHGYKLLSTY